MHLREPHALITCIKEGGPCGPRVDKGQKAELVINIGLPPGYQER